MIGCVVSLAQLQYVTFCICGLCCTPHCRYDYTLAREYNWNVKNKLTRGYEETYFMVFREDGCYYNELETRSVTHAV